MIGITTLSGEAAGIAEAAAIGILLGIYYDLFRILRRVFRFRYATIVFQDLFFFITSAIPVFFCVCYLCGGIVRIYIVVLALLCALLYCSTFGTVIVFLVSALLKFIGKVLNYVYRHTLKRAGVKLTGLVKGLHRVFCGFFKKISSKNSAINKKTS